MQKLKVRQERQMQKGANPALCPHCGKEGMFVPIGHDVGIDNNVICGQRRCPNPACKGHLFVVFEHGSLITSYPPVRIAFNSNNVPTNVCKTFEETLDCHSSNCYVAAAIMVRRTLEEICSDRSASGNNLKERIKDLESKIVLPRELIDAMDELRLLGNDAAHIEARTFSQISKAELDVAIEFTKEIIKGLYQYSTLLEHLRSLKSDSGT